MTKPRPSSQNIQIQGETLEKIDDLRDAAHRRGLRKSYPGVVADAVNVFYDISTGATTSVLQQVADQREVTLGISVMAILVTVIQSGQNVKDCECVFQPVVDAIGIILPNGYTVQMPAMGADPEKVFRHCREMLIRSGIAKQEAGADGPISTIDLDQLLGAPGKEK